jgi:DNA end-binding protein Ku
MARSMWNGALSVQGLDIPVKVFAATESHTPSFRELHEKDGAPIEHRKVSSKTGREVSNDKIVKGYEGSNGKWVVLTDEEIKAVERPERKAIEIEAFVPAEQVDPVHYDRAYYLGAGGKDEARDAFAAMLTALEKTELVGIGRVVLRSKEQLVAIRAGDGVLRMSTMRFHDELLTAKDMDIQAPRKKPSDKEIQMAAKLIDGLHEDWDPKKYKDTYRKRVEDYAKAKKQGRPPKLELVPPPEETDDLMAALQASLKDAA